MPKSSGKVNYALGKAVGTGNWNQHYTFEDNLRMAMGYISFGFGKGTRYEVLGKWGSGGPVPFTSRLYARSSPVKAAYIKWGSEKAVLSLFGERINSLEEDFNDVVRATWDYVFSKEGRPSMADLTKDMLGDSRKMIEELKKQEKGKKSG